MKKHTYIIAEAGVNHNGSVEMAKELIIAAVKAGADAVKFQTFKAEAVAIKQAPKAEYQIEATNSRESQIDMLRQLELPLDAYPALMALCREQRIDFLSKPSDMASLGFLANGCRLPILKVGSGEVDNLPFLVSVARTGKSVIFSTGMSTLGEVETALGALAYGYLYDAGVPCREQDFLNAYTEAQRNGILKEKVRLLHCTTEYPAPFEEVNLAAIDTLRQSFGLEVGYSDHTDGIAVAIGAVARGATIIEKHFTLDRTLPGPDHKASIEPKDLVAMVKAIRQIEVSIGDGIKRPTEREKRNLPIVRKSLVAKCSIMKGERFSEDNITMKRPANGMSPSCYWALLGKYACRDYKADEMIQEETFEERGID